VISNFLLESTNDSVLAFQPIMSWLWEGGVLVAVGVLVRRALRMGMPKPEMCNGLTVLNCSQSRLFNHMLRDLEIETAILGVALNDAMEERDAGNAEIAWRLVMLGASEWDRLAATVVVLLNQISRYLPVSRLDSPVRRMHPDRFKSKSMIDYVRLHEILPQFVFHSKLRFQLHLRVLRRAVETLNTEFRLLHRTAERSAVRPLDLWGRLDFYFHDLDLLTKEALLALRSFLPGLSETELQNFDTDLHSQLPRLAQFSQTIETK